MASSTKKVQQRTRRQRQVAAAAAARRSFTTAHPSSILRNKRHDRNNIRTVMFSATCTAKVYGKRSFPRTVGRFEETEERIMLPHVEEVVPQPEEEEESVRFGHDAGHNEPVEPIARRTRKRASRRREVARLSSDLGAYWSVAAATSRVRRVPVRFVPTF